MYSFPKYDMIVYRIVHFCGGKQMKKQGKNFQIDFDEFDILSATDLGLWVIRMNESENRFEMYADTTMLRILGAEEPLDPRECYQHWKTNINPNYTDYVNRAVSSMITEHQVIQLQYIWTHPTFGDVQVRCVGVRGDDSDGMICLKGYHRLISRNQKAGLIQMHATEAERTLELENLRIRDFYRASLSDTIAYAELDLENDHIQTIGGIWKDDAPSFDDHVNRFLQYLVDRQHEHMSHRQNDPSCICADTNELRAMLETGRQTHRFIYKCLLDNEWRWVELVTHTFQEQIFHNQYALLYLKDVDTQKKHELAQQEAAETDPLTKVYNRKTFERELRLFLENPKESGHGILILLDIDNFKQVNDLHGHLTGDAVLRQVAYSLESVFYKNGIIGRFGGDEFLIFIRNEQNTTSVNADMDQLYDLLHHAKTIPVCYSAGIVSVHADHFLYTDALRQADEALYESKHLGKNQYTWASSAINVS